jgi:catalase
MAGPGNIGRYVDSYDWASQARTPWRTLDIYAQQHTVNAYRFELGHVSNPNVTQMDIDTILNPTDSCLACRVGYGIGAGMLPFGSGPMTNSTAPFPSLYPLAQSQEPKKSNAGLMVGIIAADNMYSTADLAVMSPLLGAQQVSYEVVVSRQGMLATEVIANQSYITTSDILYMP